LEDLFDLQEKSKLELIFKNSDLNSVVNSLKNDSKKGARGCNIRSIIRAFLLKE